ncbi:glycerol-3-phosphate 1-O-acyltransferase PlsY [Pseudoramibacter alactolyticus]|uniref:glycerol-3-phosphate 1-O-acyltransferase PlsY n=1 Tax=Pseudoramibacter alactolyticus TaxID=113287 RepID=UPI0028E2262A|nr:glycerol-3-phosphate 1-O-acyltransferase PlsY [Pseudoramibacter alactolyticus]
MNVVWGVLLLIASYFVGNLDFAYIVVKAVRGEDIRNFGSGNAGTTNVLRTMGLKYAGLVLLLDALKGSLCIVIARLLESYLGLSPWWTAGTGIAVLCGHNWPALLKFRGGKGTATSIGLFLVYDWRIALICIAVGLILLVIFRMVSLSSMMGMTILPFVALGFFGAHNLPALALTIFMALSTDIQHRSNIKRILNGTESKIGQRVDMKK